MNEDQEKQYEETINDLLKRIEHLKAVEEDRELGTSGTGKALTNVVQRRGDWLLALGQALGLDARVCTANIDIALDRIANLRKIASMLGTEDLNEAIVRLDGLLSYERLLNEYEEGLTA